MKKLYSGIFLIALIVIILLITASLFGAQTDGLEYPIIVEKAMEEGCTNLWSAECNLMPGSVMINGYEFQNGELIENSEKSVSLQDVCTLKKINAAACRQLCGCPA